MMRISIIALAAICLAACTTSPAGLTSATQSASPPSLAPASPATMPPEARDPAGAHINVMLAPGHDPTSGRLIVIATPVKSVPEATATPWPRYLSGSRDSYIAAQEAPFVAPGQPTRINADQLAYPLPLSRIPEGDYWLQVRLDTNHNAAFSMLDPDNDFTSIPVKLHLPASDPIRATLTPERDVALQGKQAPAPTPAITDPNIRDIDFVSPQLSTFWGREIHIRGLVLLPPGYDTSKERYPTVYRTEGFGGSLAGQRLAARRHLDLMKTGQTPPMIRVFLDHSSPSGTHEFADSVNNGPWGKVLVEELIPALEKQYRMDAQPSGRFTTGHSSGGWFAIWQQVRYPKVFGGTWARAPDPVDFRSFTGVDLYAPNANAYIRTDGSAQYLVRDAKGVETTTLKDYAARENVLGDFGGQFDSFDWVFSPKGNDGRPREIFDRITGKVDPEIAAYWRTNYDIGAIVRRDWTTLKANLDGKIHLIIGTNDTFHLDEAARLLQQELDALGARSSFTYMEGRNHGNLDAIGEDPMGLEKKIAAEMYAVARPSTSFKAAPGPAIVKNAPPPAP
jgi:Putative esterase